MEFNPFFGWHLNLDWTNILPDANKKIEDDRLWIVRIFFMMMLFKGVFASLAGPAPNYDMQKILSTTIAKRSYQDDRFCFYHIIADPLFNDYWLNRFGLTYIIIS